MFNDYLNFFLPVKDRDINFPKFQNLNIANQQSKTSMLHPEEPFVPSSYLYKQKHTSLFKRVILKSEADSRDLGILSEPDRVNDMKKIDLFLRIITDCLLTNFTINENETKYSMTDAIIKYDIYKDHNKIHQNKNTSLLSMTTSNTSRIQSLPLVLLNRNKYMDSKEYLANTEIFFVLVMFLKHSHLFKNASLIYNNGKLI